jgi:hypothetical protein
VNCLYIAEQKNPTQEMNDCFAEFPTLLECINKARLEGSTDEFYNAMHAMLTVFNDFGNMLDDLNALTVEDYQAKLAGFNIQAKTYLYVEAMRFPEPHLTAVKEAVVAEIQQLCDKEVWKKLIGQRTWKLTSIGKSLSMKSMMQTATMSKPKLGL